MDKKIFKEEFGRVQTLVNAFDPLSFISIGAPKNEYDSLVYKIIGCISEGKSKKEIGEILLAELIDYYGMKDPKYLKEPYKTAFFNDLDKMLKQL